MATDKDKRRDPPEPPNPYDLRQIYEEMELYLINSMRRNLKRHMKEEERLGFAWEQWQKATLRNIEQFRHECREIIGEMSAETQRKVEEVLNGSYDSGYSTVERAAERQDDEKTVGMSLPDDGKNTAPVGQSANPEQDFFKANPRKLNALSEAVEEDLDNANRAVYRKMDDIYRQTVFKATYKMSSGALTLQQAVDEASKELLAHGIKCIQYKNGAQVDVVSYVEMAIRTASQRARMLGEGAFRDKHQLWLVRVSSHTATCSLCQPWQGEILIDDVFSHPSEDFLQINSNKYKSVSESIKAGLFHPNCRHTLYTYFPNDREPTVASPEESARLYKAEQKLRALERSIRQAKRDAEAAIDPKNQEQAKKKLKHCQALLREHLKQNPELKRNRWREKERV